MQTRRSKSRASNRRRIGGCALLCAALFGLFVLGSPASASDSLVNGPAPEIARPDLHGNAVSLGALRGKVVLLNFWATWCAPCRLEMPRFVSWQRQFGPGGLQIVGVSIDDSEAPARAFADRLNLNYPVVMGDARLGERYGGVLGVPVTFLIDRHGIVRARIDGETDLAILERRVRALLATP